MANDRLSAVMSSVLLLQNSVSINIIPIKKTIIIRKQYFDYRYLRFIYGFLFSNKSYSAMDFAELQQQQELLQQHQQLQTTFQDQIQ